MQTKVHGFGLVYSRFKCFIQHTLRALMRVKLGNSDSSQLSVSEALHFPENTKLMDVTCTVLLHSVVSKQAGSRWSSTGYVITSRWLLWS